jgi:electron transfer flavoprotein alpha subunit
VNFCLVNQESTSRAIARTPQPWAHVANDAAYERFLAENVAPLVVQLMDSHDAVLFPATATGKNVSHRARCDAAVGRSFGRFMLAT